MDAIAARGADGHIVLSAVNLDPTQALTLRVHLGGGARLHSAHGEQLTAARVDAVNTFEKPLSVVPQAIAPARAADGALLLTLPAKSVSVLQIE